MQERVSPTIIVENVISLEKEGLDWFEYLSKESREYSNLIEVEILELVYEKFIDNNVNPNSVISLLEYNFDRGNDTGFYTDYIAYPCQKASFEMFKALVDFDLNNYEMPAHFIEYALIVSSERAKEVTHWLNILDFDLKYFLENYIVEIDNYRSIDSSVFGPVIILILEEIGEENYPNLDPNGKVKKWLDNLYNV